MEALDVLSEKDFIVVIDASASMTTDDMPGGRTRWEAVQETAEAFARDLAKVDSDGLGLVIFSGTGVDSFDGVNADKIREAFQTRSPRGSTPLAEALKAALQLAGKSDKNDFVVIFTDGVPDDKDAAAKVIIDASKKLINDDDLTFLFVQVGKDPEASKYLRKLDDDLKGAKFDIVDAKTMEEAERFTSTAELIAHSIND